MIKKRLFIEATGSLVDSKDLPDRTFTSDLGESSSKERGSSRRKRATDVAFKMYAIRSHQGRWGRSIYSVGMKKKAGIPGLAEDGEGVLVVIAVAIVESDKHGGLLQSKSAVDGSEQFVLAEYLEVRAQVAHVVPECVGGRRKYPVIKTIARARADAMVGEDEQARSSGKQLQDAKQAAAVQSRRQPVATSRWA